MAEHWTATVADLDAMPSNDGPVTENDRMRWPHLRVCDPWPDDPDAT
jgi:hypothetical protein